MYDKETQRYIPTIAPVDWDIKSLSKEERKKILERLVVRVITKETEYQSVISYLHEKYWDLMDKNVNGKLQWHYSPSRRKQKINHPNLGEIDMVAYVYYDPERDWEPVAVGGSYFTNVYHDGVREIGGMGYVLFVDPDYRRMGIASDQWIQESKLYTDAGVKYVQDIQNEDSLAVTQSIFKDPSKCLITSVGRIRKDGKRAMIRILMDYTDESFKESWEELPDNMKDLYGGKPDFRFIEREDFTKEELIKPWSLQNKELGITK